jgi:hypothetical protein
MRNFICLIILLAGLDLQAQVFLPGKLMTSEGDTLVGFVAEQGGITWSFKETKNGVVRIFTRRQVVGFQRKDERYEEHTVEVLRGKFPERVKDFLLVVEEGQVRLLRYDGVGIFGSDHTCYFLHEKDMAMPLRVNVDPANFKVQIRQYFSDYPELAAKIKSKELGYEKIQEIVQLYNSWYKLQPHDDESKPVDKEPDVEKPAKEKKPKKEKVDKDEESSEE